MLSIYQLMKYLRNTHHINVKSSQTQALRNMGYYHGFKGYRFVREDTNRINFSSLDEVIALNKYDMQLKSILYPNPDKPEKLFLFSTPCVILKKKGVFICYSLINTLIKFMASLPVMTA